MILLMEPPDIIYRGVDNVIGDPQEYEINNIKGFPRMKPDYNAIPDNVVYDNGYYPIVKKDSEGFTPLKLLNKYHRFFTVKVRVTKKYPKKTYNNVKGAGVLFTIEVKDKEGTLMKGTFFKE